MKGEKAMLKRTSTAVFILFVASFAVALQAADLPKSDPTQAEGPWTHHYYTVQDGTKLHYVEMGKGTPVILIHGAGGSAVGNWFANGIAPALAKTNRVIGIDMRGHSLSEAGPPEGRVNMAADVLEFMRQQGIKKAHIGGFSMGGFVTGQLMATNPEVFITAHFGGSGVMETEEWADKLPPEPKTGRSPEDEKASAEYAKIQAERGAMRGEEIGNDPAALRRGRGESNEESRTEMLERLRARRTEGGAARMRPNIDLSKVDFPVLAVNGEYDRPLAKSHRLWRELNNFTNVVLPGKGHLSAVMVGFCPQEYIDAMVQHITFNNPK